LAVDNFPLSSNCRNQAFGPAVHQELELKLELTGEEFERALAHPVLKELAIDVQVSGQLRSLYFDTLDRRLHAQGLSLRVRRVGDGWVQTVKCETGVHSGVSHPVELESTVSGAAPELTAIPDKPLRKQIRKTIGKAPLVPLFETVVQRTAQRLKAADGAEIEIAFDKGVVRGAEGTQDICETELELKSGGPDAIVSVAERLFAGEAIRFSEMSKAELGHRLSVQRPPARLEPAKASTPDIDATQSCGEALREICYATTEQILHNWRVTGESDDPEGAHQMRIGLRRLRSALKVFRPILGDETLRDLDRKARDLGRLIGELRDADVIATDIVQPAAANREEDADFAALRNALAHTRTYWRDKVRAELKSEKWCGLRLKLAMLSESVERLAKEPQNGALAKPIGNLTDKALAKWWKRVAKSGRRLDELTATERHELRKDLKTLRYAIEMLAPLYKGKKVRGFAKELRLLQDRFGYLNDVAVAEKLKRADSVAGDPDLQRAVGYVIGWHTARAEDTWQDVRVGWQRLQRAPRFWA
jgi:triphosphatase